jgi:hypothetical protein
MRHDSIQRILVEAIMKHRKLKKEETFTNRIIHLEKFSELKYTILGNEDRQRSDIQLCADVTKDDEICKTWKFHVLEIAIPFSKEAKDDEHSNTLK